MNGLMEHKGYCAKICENLEQFLAIRVYLVVPQK